MTENDLKQHIKEQTGVEVKAVAYDPQLSKEQIEAASKDPFNQKIVPINRLNNN